jgi:hypothetical protein
MKGPYHENYWVEIGYERKVGNITKKGSLRSYQIHTLLIQQVFLGEFGEFPQGFTMARVHVDDIEGLLLLNEDV